MKPDLVPVRHGRMMVSPFTFYRGAAKIMAADLKDTPTAGLNTQLCGDAHLSNFGVFASPERALRVRPERLRRDAARPVRVRREAHGGQLHDRRPEQRLHRRPQARDAALASAAAYREAMAEFAEMRTMEIWYAHSSEQDLLDAVATMTGSLKGADKKAAKTRCEEARRKTAQEGTHPRQPAGTIETRGVRRRRVPDRQPTTGRRPRTRPGGAASACPPKRSKHSDPRAVPQVPRHAAGRSTSPARTIRGGRRRPQSRRRRQRRHRGVHRVAPGPRSTGPAVLASQGSDRSRCSRITCRRAATASPANESCKASG